jgi:hypothetical protein
VNALELLRDDHRLFRRLLADGEEASSVSASEEVCGALAAHLTVHLQLEEELLYPIVEEADPGTARAARTGHRLAERVVEELTAAAGSDRWPQAVASARGVFDEHLATQERQVFEEAERALGPNGVEVLGDRMETVRNAMIR